MNKIELQPVFPSNKNTIFAIPNGNDPYNGAHKYEIIPCEGFSNGESVYRDDLETIKLQFVQKNDDDDSLIPGLQSEQLVIMLLDRHVKLNNRFPSPQSEKMIQGLQIFLDACKERVQDRIDRGVMGDLKK